MTAVRLSSPASLRSFLRLLCATGLLCAGISHAAAQKREDVPELAPGIPAGYLKKEQRFASAALLPAPPTSGSAAAAFDAQMHARAATLRGTPRWYLAIRDASLHPDKLTSAFACSLGVAITRKDTPRLYQLLQRVAVDTGLSTEDTKHRYKAIRQVTVDGKPPAVDHGADIDAAGNGIVSETRLYQLVRQSGDVRERVFEIRFLDADAEAYAFTFG